MKLLNLTESEVLAQASQPGNIDHVIDVLSKLEPDKKYGPLTLDLLKNGKPETRAFLTYLVKEINPSNYMEIGTRRGWSASVVASLAPECEIYSFDEWHEGYGGVENPGPSFVQSEVEKFGYWRDINFISGNSHETVKKFFDENPDKLFDMILVDGDHTVDGAYQDLSETMPFVKVGGAIVFDDILDCEGLYGLWIGLKYHFPNFKYYTFKDNKPGVGFAIRIM